ncbi:copper resistance D family protein [Acidocella aromatica]|uniref:Putative copper resistance protein D n=1 Tax=Acidocella aromatica TaxID=1303579 RepID=A0A840V7Y9_9PROT|nr:CopD family protein [Acidocella aromatica]MBB5372078.1 putative copper resistance protein D [Acidocella aromatica]
MDSPAWLVLRGLCRGLHLAGCFSVSGTMVLAATLLRGARVPGLKLLAWGGFALALGAGAGWFLLQTAYFAAAQGWADIITASPIVAQDTRFGALLLGRVAVLLLAMLLFQAGWTRPAALLGLGGVLAQAWLGHGGAMNGPEGNVLLASAVLHLAGAALWLGTLPALLLALRHLPGDEAARLARRFSPLGMACVAVLLSAAVVQFVLLIGGVGALFSSAYGALVSAKLLALAVLIGLAARNKFRLTPSLPGSRAALCRTVALEIGLGFAVLLAAGVLLQLEPPAMAGMAGM